MGQITPNMGIYIPAAGETNYDASFAAGMVNVDQHDHSGGPNKGVPLSSSGIADGSITRTKLNANVVLAGGGLAVDSGSPNALKVDGVLLPIFNLATNGYIVRTGATSAASRVFQAGPGISLTNADGVSGNTTISSSGGGVGWTEVTGTSQAMSPDNGYVANNAGLVTLTLPTTAAFGTFLSVAGKGTGLFAIAQNASQLIHFGNTNSTTGVGGSITATNRYDVIQMVCTVANLEWTVIASVGNLTIV